MIRTFGLSALLLSACVESGAGDEGGIAISEARLNPPLGGRDVGAAYMTIDNSGSPTEIVAASSPDADVIELHRSSREGGIARMEKLDTLPLPMGETRLEQGGLHLMMFGFTSEEAADGVEILLEFADGRTATVRID